MIFKTEMFTSTAQVKQKELGKDGKQRQGDLEEKYAPKESSALEMAVSN